MTACDNGGLVILDGPDACGKTTLARQLLEGDDGGYIHLTYDPKWDDPNRTLWIYQYFSLIKAALRLDKGKMTVIDRHWMSEQVYSRVYRGGSALTAECRQWDRVIQRLCGVYVICAPDVRSAVDRHAQTHSEREEMYRPGPEIRYVAGCFRSLYYGGLGRPPRDYAEYLTAVGMNDREDATIYDIDRDGHDLESVCARIRVHLSNRQMTQYPPAFNYGKGNYLGHPRHARILFVGERINPNKSGRWPFVDYGASSKVFGDALQALQFNETHAMWTNAYALDEHVETLVEWFPHLKVVAVGGDAACYLDDKKIVHKSIVHPAYAWRFNKVEFFTEQLAEVIA